MDAGDRTAGLARMRAYVATLQPLMQLTHWTFIINDEYPSDGYGLISFERLGSRNCGHLRFSDHHFGNDPGVQRHSVVHELLHAKTANLLTACFDTAEWFDPTRCQLVRERLLHEIEVAVDELANLIAPMFPLPPAASEEA